MSGPGIDYGMGTANRDPDTGIRYGVISQHSVSQAWADEAEGDYGEPTCPKCGSEVLPFGEGHGDVAGDYDQYERGCADYVCHVCALTLDSSDVFSEEALGWSVDNEEYQLTSCLDTDIMILRSPYYTFAPFCSPCVPGAGNLDDATDEANGVKTYCLGHDWFYDSEPSHAPYPVYSVETGRLVEPEQA